MIQHLALLYTDLSCEKYTVGMEQRFSIYEGIIGAVNDGLEWQIYSSEGPSAKLTVLFGH